MRSRLVFVIASLAVLVGSSATVSTADTLPRVTLIGDSIASALAYTPSAIRLLKPGIDLQLDLAPCRRVAPNSCPYDGRRASTVLELVESAGADLGSTVIVAVGYNDFEAPYPENIKDAVVALRRAGVKRILWVTLRAERHSYLSMNDAIREAGARSPDVTVVDWNALARTHPDWFQDDGLHLKPEGAIRMASLFRQALVELAVPTPPLVVTTPALPLGRIGSDYGIRLSAVGGGTPYRWSSGLRLPRGLHLTPAGRIYGTPVRVGSFPVVLKVTDAAGTPVTKQFVLRVRPST
ncbi:MAG: putative Ig domain-containing protein [Gaiella sp.]